MADADKDDVQNVTGSNDQAVNQNESAPDANAAEIDFKAKYEETLALLEKSRKVEKDHKTKKDAAEARLAEFDSWKNRAEHAEQKLTNMSIDAEMSKQLNKVAKDADAERALLKLIDRGSIVVKDGVADAESINSAIAKAKEEHGFLFKKAELPEMRRSTEGQATGGFKAEMAAARKSGDPKQVRAVAEKYGVRYDM